MRDEQLVGVTGTRRSMKELVDGTLRVQIDIDPQFKRAFLAMFPSIDTAVVIAPFMGSAAATPAEAAESAARSTAATQARHERREQRLSEYAAFLCEKGEFHGFLTDNFRSLWDVMNKDWSVVDRAAECVRRICEVSSRSHLDTKPEAATLFHTLIREPYAEWLRRQ